MALQPKNTQLSQANALALAQASSLAYADAATIKNNIAAVIGAPLREFEAFDIPTHDTSVFMAGFDEAVIISFQGTKVIANWLTDAEIRLVPFRNRGLIHMGFRAALDTVYPQIDQALQAWAGRGRTLWITGHSLGGALALLTGAYIRFPVDETKTLPRPIAGLYTFGQPRVGTHDFCNACAANFGAYYFRYVNYEDIVTRVPPRVLSYWHIDNVEYIDGDKQIYNDPAWWQIFLDRVKGGVEALETLRAEQPIIDLVADHAIKDYIAAIAAAAKIAPVAFA